MEPSLPALLGTLIVAGACFLACLTLITPENLRDHGPYFMAHRDDQMVQYAYELLRLPQRATDDTLQVLILSSSATHEALAPERRVNELLNERFGRPVQVKLLYCGTLHHFEMLMLADHLPAAFRGLVLMEVSHKSLQHDRAMIETMFANPRIPLPSPAAESVFDDMGLAYETNVGGNYFITFFKSYIVRPRAVLNVVTGPPRIPPHMAMGWRPPTEREWAGIIQRRFDSLQRYVDNHEINYELYAKVIDRLRSPGRVEPVLITVSRNPRLMEAIEADPTALSAFTRFQTELDDFAARMDVPLWNPMSEVALEPGDFIDDSHLTDRDAQEQVTQRLVDHVVAYLNEKFPDAGPGQTQGGQP